MPKLKTHKASVKRFKITGSGKILRLPAAGNHLLTNKSDRKNRYQSVSKIDRKKVRKLIARG
ncbi:50S ribosomal protein L35 [Candidatus Berkelbacteria bacterium CG_4_9_14_0_2_um_filter_42_30]|uniref:Large ribosomal subunit protein bL35 n=1 Tax=Candidatus Berkelbacteria bacterium CG_4_9_14_0_2_um_filter_42_30 TaxID=1974506 RepID=A0A2M8G253_9BACT|nr:MAG: 50S ribosomal protein L35 [Candidatus Berkelbacteria bacterium CG_4_9_14_0_2_um_filter_42_30]